MSECVRACARARAIVGPRCPLGSPVYFVSASFLPRACARYSWYRFADAGTRELKCAFCFAGRSGRLDPGDSLRCQASNVFRAGDCSRVRPPDARTHYAVHLPRAAVCDYDASSSSHLHLYSHCAFFRHVDMVSGVVLLADAMFGYSLPSLFVRVPHVHLVYVFLIVFLFYASSFSAVPCARGRAGTRCTAHLGRSTS